MNDKADQHRRLRAIVISSVQPEPTTAGQIKLYRHLVENPEIQLAAHPAERRLFLRQGFGHRFVLRLGRTRLNRWVADAEMLSSARWLDGRLSPPPDGLPNVVITVAHGNGCWAALRYARKHRFPLVTFFDDWWPDMDAIHAPFHGILERRFRELYRQSDLALCVSEEFISLLGPHPNAQVLYPMPARAGQPLTPPPQNAALKVLYFGNLDVYGPMVAEALRELQNNRQVRLEVRGGNPRWPQVFLREMKRAGHWLDYAARAELEHWLQSADAFLVPMVFDPALRRRMQTSFPSKMLEMAQLGKPLVIWGPDYSSAVRWAQSGARALCVTDPNPSALGQALNQLAAFPEERRRLSAAAQQAAQTDFNPGRIQAQFMRALRGLVEK